MIHCFCFEGDGLVEKYNETKEKIIQRSLELIKKNGYDQVTINDICEASGISKHTFYYYFKSKEEVLMRFFHVPYDLTTKRMTDIIAMDSPVQQYWHIIEPRIQHFCNLGALIVKQVLITNLQREVGTFRQDKSKEALCNLEQDLITKGQEKKEILNLMDPASLRFALRIQVIGLVSLWAMGKEMDLMVEAKNLFKTTLQINDSVKF